MEGVYDQKERQPGRADRVSYRIYEGRYMVCLWIQAVREKNTKREKGKVGWKRQKH